jgi:hypothetical protein
MPPFVIFALPRSRTFWLSRYLSYAEWHCGHDELRHARALDDIRSWFGQPCTGTIETLAAPWWRLAQTLSPKLRIIVVRRPVADVVQSLARQGFDPVMMTPLMTRLDRKLDQIAARVADVFSVSFDDLASEDTVARLFEHCLPYRHDPEWYALMAPRNLQISLPPLIRYMRACQPQMAKLAKIAKAHCLADLRIAPRDFDGVTIQEETFDDVLRDGKHLFEAHCMAVGEAPDAWLGKNIPLMRQLETMGALFFTTARSNGRLFGYLQTAISPSLESPEERSAINLLFFTDGTIPGLGLKLQRASVASLKARGVDELFLRAGVRGAGPRLDVLYRRMGAEDFGQMYRLNLKDAA